MWPSTGVFEIESLQCQQSNTQILALEFLHWIFVNHHLFSVPHYLFFIILVPVSYGEKQKNKKFYSAPATSSSILKHSCTKTCNLTVKLQAFKRHITQLEGQLWERGQKDGGRFLSPPGSNQWHIQCTNYCKQDCHSTSSHLSQVDSWCTISSVNFAPYNYTAHWLSHSFMHKLSAPTQQASTTFKISWSMGQSCTLSCLLHPSTKSFIPQICLQDTSTLIYICADCKSFVTCLINPKLGFFTFQFSWDDVGVTMWVRRTCDSGSEGFEDGVGRAAML